jgi:hypothetical protein
MINMEDYFDMLQEAVARNAHRNKKIPDDAADGHDGATNNHAESPEEPESSPPDLAD